MLEALFLESLVWPNDYNPYNKVLICADRAHLLLDIDAKAFVDLSD